MAEFAKIGLNNLVLDVVSVADEVVTLPDGRISEDLGIKFLYDLFGHETWLLTYPDGSFRKNHAHIGGYYDSQRDAFIQIGPPYPSWTLDEETCQWTPPIPVPKDGKMYRWDDENHVWIEIPEPT